MRVLKPRSALLSDFEVLRALKEMETEQQARMVKPRIQEVGGSDEDTTQEKNDDVWLTSVPENLRTIQYETISTLSQVTRPCAHQREEDIAAFLNALKSRGYSVTDSESKRGALGLNKSERLQIVNHAPQSVVELHTLVEELEERFLPQQIEELLYLVQTHLPLNSDGEINVYAQDGPNGESYEASEILGQQSGEQNPLESEQISEFTGQVAAGADLGDSKQTGLAEIPPIDEERQVADLEYEEDPAVEMDEDDFVHEGFGGGAVEDAERDD